MGANTETETDAETVDLQRETIERLQNNTEADGIEDSIDEAVKRLEDDARWRRIEIVQAFANTVALEGVRLFWRNARNLFYALFAAALGLLSGSYWITALFFAAAIYAFGSGVVGTFFSRTRHYRSLYKHFKEIGAIRDHSDFRVLEAAETPDEVFDGLLQLQSGEDIETIRRWLERQPEPPEDNSESVDSPEATDTPPDEPEPTLWLDERAFSEIKTLRRRGVIEEGDLADAVFREVRINTARNQGPEIELDPEEILDVVSELNQRVDSGRFVTYDGKVPQQTRLDYHPDG